MIEIIKANTHEDCILIANLAKRIIPKVYYPIVAPAHVNMFIDKYQTVEAIEEQLKNGFQYFFLLYDKELVGYLGIVIRSDSLLLSKLYILEEYRGKKIGKKALIFTEDQAKNSHCTKIELLVNEYNTSTIDLYKYFNYSIVDLVHHNFEDGLVVRDYRMEKIL